ncbi:ATP/GTP-binding protein [Streptomyces sp. IBSNAI002]|uniref:ATP/GTP-binding protein n=1 Tax=Streptomyces sp. IBSNAI002 TaxID=3457500 RepID=UPI003FD0C7C3
MADLRALFSSNNPSEYDAVEAFTDRQYQWAVTAAALGEHLHHVASAGFDVEDLEAPRSNLIMFHGVGGAGKSTLLRKIEAALTAAEERPAQWGAPSWTQRLLPIRIDLSRSASTGADFERAILTIRLALAGALGRGLPSFDVALRHYWEVTHPGELLDEYVRRTGIAGRFTNLLPGQLQAGVGEVAAALALPGLIGSAAGQLTSALVTALRERHERAQALAGAKRTVDLLEATPDLEALSFYPHLLAYDLDQLPAKKRIVPVVLLDTFEDTADRHRDLERLLQRLVWLAPNVFFVVAGRSRLQWADPALHGQLDWTGPTAWPGLASSRTVPAPRTGEHSARQHLIGDLSPQDCETHLARRLTIEGRPLIDADVRAAITARSHGLPLHLDLAVSRFLEIRRTGRAPVPADFDYSFPALLARTLSDLTAEERHLLRSVSLLDAWDLDLATRTAGLTHQAPARRLTERPLIAENSYALWPYHLHRAIRSAVREDTHSEDRWTQTDWKQAATRALAALGDQWTTAAALGPSRLLLVACLRQALRLARDYRLTDLGWLTDAAYAYADDSVWEPLTLPTDTTAGPVPDTAADALAEVLTAITRRQHEHRQRTVDRLSAVLDSGLLSSELRELALYYRAKAYKDLGQGDAARAGMRQVAVADGRLAPKARRGLANLSRLAGDFPTALAAVPTLGWKGRHHRVLGDIRWSQADTAQAVVAFEAGRAEAEERGVAGERAMMQVRLGLALSFADPTRAAVELSLAHQLLESLDQRSNTLLAQTAALIKDAGIDGVIDRAQVLDTEIQAAGLPFLHRFVALATAFHQAVRGEDQELGATISRLRELTVSGDFAYFVDIAHFMAGLPRPAASTTRWTQTEGQVRAAWHGLVQARQEHLRTSS